MIGWGEEMRPAFLRHRTARAVPRLRCPGTSKIGPREKRSDPFFLPPGLTGGQFSAEGWQTIADGKPSTVAVPASPFSWRLGVRMCLSRKDAKVNRHRTARAVPLLCRHQSRGIVANRSWGSDFSVHSVFSVVNTVVVDRHEPAPDGSRRAAFM